ncbi:unnamed protein product, partial (mitochondrion) [Musa banksii]
LCSLLRILDLIPILLSGILSLFFSCISILILFSFFYLLLFCILYFVLVLGRIHILS